MIWDWGKAESNHDVSPLTLLERRVGRERIWRGANGEGHGKRGSNGSTGGCICWETELRAPFSTSWVTRILPTLHLSQIRLSWRRGTETYIENSHLVIHTPAFHGTRFTKPQNSPICSGSSDPLVTVFGNSGNLSSEIPISVFNQVFGPLFFFFFFLTLLPF